MSEYAHLLDPELRAAGLMMRENMAEYTPMTRRKLAKRRAWMHGNALPPHEHVSWAEQRIARPASCGEGPDVLAYVVNAKPGANGPGILHIHGGGFTASTALLGLRGVQENAEALDVPIVSVEYRLAPETLWSGSLFDNYAALLWLHANAASIGIDPARITVMGESAGGGHAALLTMLARDRGEVPIAFQCLTYPMLDDRSGTSRQLAPHIGHFGWGPEANRFGWKSFLGCKPGGRKVPREAVPSRAEDLSELPPAWIGVGALDLFVEEDIDYAMRLNRVGVPTELLVVPGAFHGFDAFMKDAAVTRRFQATRLDALRRGMGIA